MKKIKTVSGSVGQTQRRIGQFIRELREKKGITQQEFSRMLQTSQSAIARMESGEQNFSTEMLSKISDVLNQGIITLAKDSQNFRVEGGQKLSGAIQVNSAKNSAVAILFASLLNQGETTLHNVPRIEEVYRIIEVLESIGVSVKWLNEHSVHIVPPKELDMDHLNVGAAIKTRSVIMLFGPLIHLLKNFQVPYPGGCKMGKRTVRPHLFALEKFGVSINATKNNYHVAVKKLAPAEVVMYEAGDTPTENAVMAASKINGTSVIKFATSNYQVQDTCRFIQALGVQIDGIGTSTLTVHGVSNINKNVSFTLSNDPIEAMFFIALAVTTNSSITIQGCPIDFLELELLKLEKMGYKYKILRRYVSENGFTNLVDIQTFPSRLIALEDKLHPLPYPGLNIDNLPFFVPIATQAEGETLIHDWVYENRAIYYTELNKLGADITLADPHRVFVKGPTELRGTHITCPPALRPSVTILIAMLGARGTSLLKDVYSINRGYEDLDKRLQSIGARIELVKGI